MICSLIWLIFTLITAGILFGIGYYHHRKWKVMRDTPTRMIVDIEPGRVEVNGMIQPAPGALLNSPITQTPCVQFEVQVQELRRSKNSSYWATIHKNKRGNVFLLVDESGKVLIDPRNVKMDLIQTLNSHRGPFNEMKPKVRAYIRQTGVRVKGFFGVFNKTLRVLESVIPINKNLYVLGDAVDDPKYHPYQIDPITSPFTIRKEDMMILSFKSEKELARSKRTIWVLLYSFGGFCALIGLVGMIYLILM
jgi:hypothetical protein